MGHPRHKERANRARAMAAQGITLPATGLKRVREDDLSDSFGKVKLEDASGFRASKQSKVTSSVSLEVKATDPVIPKVEVSPGLVQVQASTSQPPPAGPTITLKFEGEGAHIANRDRLRKAYWTEKPVFSDVYKKKIFSDDMTEDEKKEAIKQSYIATVEDLYGLGWRHHARNHPNNEPVPRDFVVARAREHLRIADKCECEIFTPDGLTEYETAIWNNEVLNWPHNKHLVERTLVVDVDVAVPYEHPKFKVPALDKDCDTEMSESAPQTKGTYKIRSEETTEVAEWDRDTDNCHWDGESPREGSLTGAMYWWGIDNSKFPAVPSPIVKPHFAEQAANVLKAVYKDASKGTFGAKSSPKNNIKIPGDEKKELNMRQGYFPPPDSDAFKAPPPDIGCMPIHDRYSYWLVWLQANGYTGNQFVWLCGKDCDSLREDHGLKKQKDEADDDTSKNHFNTTLWMRATRLRDRYMKDENRNGVTKLTRGKGKKTQGRKTKSKTKKNKGKKVSKGDFDDDEYEEEEGQEEEEEGGEEEERKGKEERNEEELGESDKVKEQQEETENGGKGSA